MKTDTEKFWNLFVEQPTGCWERPTKVNCKTYSTVKWKGRETAAHRLAAFLSGKLKVLHFPRSSNHKDHVLHTCDNKRCCNPSHLIVGTYSENIIDAYRRNIRPSKLSIQIAEQIRAEYLLGETQVDLAKRYGVSQVAISKIVRNETYTVTA